MKIAFDRFGSGKPVVFLHSGLADRTMWEPQKSAFAERFTCYAVDLPGYGESDTPPGAFSFAQEIASFIETAVGAPAALVGSSYGAGIAFDTAQFAPEWTGPLVLVDGLLIRSDEPSPLLEAVWRDADAAWDAGDRDRAVELEIEFWVDGHGRPAGRAPTEVRDYFRQANHAVWERHAADPPPDPLPSSERTFEQIAEPVLLIDGPYDFPGVLTSNQAVLKRLPNGTYASIADTAHFPSREAPPAFNRVVLEFLERTWGSTG
ncbi:MAG: alpha/beta hydrolase [Thermomicrobiales bacterium]|nr:alpha/beta hydrolase [Thermomicrobiales bacterium]